MGASPLISLIGNSKVVIVAYVPLLLLLYHIGNYPDSYSSKYPSKYCSYECSIDRDCCDNCSDCYGAGCFTAFPESRYWKIKELSVISGPWYFSLVSPCPSNPKSWPLVSPYCSWVEFTDLGVFRLVWRKWGPKTKELDTPNFNVYETTFCGLVFLTSLCGVDYSFSTFEINSWINVTLPWSIFFLFFFDHFCL